MLKHLIGQSTQLKALLLVLSFLLGGLSQGSWSDASLVTTAEAAVQPTAQGSVDINRANAEELTRLKGVGLKIAGNIVRYREVHGPFRSVEDLMNVKGIGGKKLEGIRDQIKL